MADNSKQKTFDNHFSAISIIYNPKSTGSGKAMATKLKVKLRNKLPSLRIDIVPTNYPGHAEELAYQLAKANKTPLIISASGDGGYNEVINGVVRANYSGCHATTGLIPAGNANDHYYDVYNGDIMASIISGGRQKIDLLKLETTIDGKPYERYAHSYIGFGMTPKLGQALNKVELNRYNEIIIVAKEFFKLLPISILMKGKKRSYYSLICSNVSRMSKVLQIASRSSNNDGLFELTVFKKAHKLGLFIILLRIATIGLEHNKSISELQFTSIERLLVQLDGEVATIDANSNISISIAEGLLECIV